MIEKNRHPGGRLGNLLFGVACIVDGLVRTISIGFLHTRLPCEVSKYQAKIMIRNLKKK